MMTRVTRPMSLSTPAAVAVALDRLRRAGTISRTTQLSVYYGRAPLPGRYDPALCDRLARYADVMRQHDRRRFPDFNG